MIRCKFVIAACLGTFCYVAVSLIGGRDGLWARQQLQEQKQLISLNTAKIEKINEELKMEKQALLQDPDVIAAYARKLGYVSEGEKLVKISGLPNRETCIYEHGSVLIHEESKYIPEWVCKAAGLVIFGLMYILMILLDYTRSGITEKPKSKDFNVVKGGVRAYEMY